MQTILSLINPVNSAVAGAAVLLPAVGSSVYNGIAQTAEKVSVATKAYFTSSLGYQGKHAGQWVSAVLAVHALFNSVVYSVQCARGEKEWNWSVFGGQLATVAGGALGYAVPAAGTVIPVIFGAVASQDRHYRKQFFSVGSFRGLHNVRRFCSERIVEPLRATHEYKSWLLGAGVIAAGLASGQMSSALMVSATIIALGAPKSNELNL